MHVPHLAVSTACDMTDCTVVYEKHGPLYLMRGLVFPLSILWITGAIHRGVDSGWSYECPGPLAGPRAPLLNTSHAIEYRRRPSRRTRPLIPDAMNCISSLFDSSKKMSKTLAAGKDGPGVPNPAKIN